jgi:hypothetical protein
MCNTHLFGKIGRFGGDVLKNVADCHSQSAFGIFLQFFKSFFVKFQIGFLHVVEGLDKVFGVGQSAQNIGFVPSANSLSNNGFQIVTVYGNIFGVTLEFG